MKHLIVYAHPDNESFTYGAMQSAVEKLNSLGESVEVRDLYKINFNPCRYLGDLRARQTGELPSDVKTEQDFIQQSDKITFISPLWWNYLPAILKGYFDRVFTQGFAYSVLENNMSMGLLSEKKFGMINTTSATKEEMERTGLGDDLNRLVDKGIFEKCSSPLCFHNILYAVDSVSEDKKRDMIYQVANVIEQFVLDPNYCPYFG